MVLVVVLMTNPGLGIAAIIAIKGLPVAMEFAGRAGRPNRHLCSPEFPASLHSGFDKLFQAGALAAMTGITA
jgi:hypothetical protein